MRDDQPEDHAEDTLVGEIVLLLRRIVYAPEGGLTAETRLADLGMDSLDLVEAGLELEALLGRDLADAALSQVRTVADLARCFGGHQRRPGLSLAA